MIDGCDTICRRCLAADIRARHAARREAGRCLTLGCPRPIADGAVRCADHLAAHADRARARAAGRNSEHVRTYRVRNAARSDAEIAAKRAEMRPDRTKQCRKCALRLPFEAFRTDRAQADGLRRECRACANSDLWRAASASFEERGTYGCIYCDAPATTVDHIRPKADHDADEAHVVDHPLNLAPACECNFSKNASHVLDYVRRALGEDVVEHVLRLPWRYVDLDDEVA
ncbi:hypothetical protein AB0L86_04860 [Micromonospora musae]|uniref:hypothetical protein n=1 Tax=Micromonospora musae TaxID=1894970 RepID=UPI0034161348